MHYFGKLRVEIGVWSILWYLILWTIFGIITLGFALLLFPYSIYKLVINKTYLINPESGTKLAKFKCDLNVVHQIWHALIWYLLVILTLGLALPFYIYYLVKFVLNKTELIPLEGDE